MWESVDGAAGGDHREGRHMAYPRTAAVRGWRDRLRCRQADVSLFKPADRGYGAPMRARQPAAVAALAVVLLLLWAPIASAGNEPPSPIGNPNYPRTGHGRDPCTVK